jgi:GABA permease
MAWKYSVLVLANVTAASDELLAALVRRAERGQCGFTLLVPATGGGSAGREAAQKGIDAAVSRMEAEGLEVESMIGDPDPVVALHEVWDPRQFDEIVISTLPTGVSRWLAADLPHRVEKLTGVQVEHVVAKEPREPARTEQVPEPDRYGVLTPLSALTGGRRVSD